MHTKEFQAFDTKLRRERPDDVSKWEEMVLAWEVDRQNSPSPFTIQTKSRSTLHCSHGDSEWLTTAVRCHSGRCPSPPPHGGTVYYGQ